MEITKIPLYKFVSWLDGISYLYPNAKLSEINKVVKDGNLYYEVEILNVETNLTTSYWVPVYTSEKDPLQNKISML